ncbi:hypothetical protein SAMN02745133_02738 [Desulforamulus putei DSM 12395]|uniref:Membrane transport protein n=2 Tax=Desulforamulus putei TaxID=74701 RepID=A0A1M5BYA0_9FIRM|nr:hypothetical protein SAMN02745133_02738 [Desulforamulus putei DSM 12395]
MALYSMLLPVVIVGLVYLLSKCHLVPKESQPSIMLSTAFINTGNMGAPVMLFAFGEAGFNYAMIINLFHSIAMNTLGIYIATGGSRQDLKKTLMTLLKFPINHAMILALIWKVLEPPMSDNIYKTLRLVGDTSVMLVVVILGMQLAECRITNLNFLKLTTAILLRLIVSPAIAFAIVLFLPVSKLWQQVMILEAAMPTAAFIAMYAVQYNQEPDFVTSVTFFTTLLSGVTLMVIIPLVLRM